MTIGELHDTINDLEEAIRTIKYLREDPRYDDYRVISVSACYDVTSALQNALKIIKAFDIGVKNITIADDYLD